MKKSVNEFSVDNETQKFDCKVIAKEFTVMSSYNIHIPLFDRNSHSTKNIRTMNEADELQDLEERLLRSFPKEENKLPGEISFM